MCICGLAIAQMKNKPAIQFATLSHDFGTLKEEAGKATHEFVFTNTGNAPLIIQQVTASCGCTTPNWTKQPIAPGATGKVTVTYATTGRPGHFTKIITVRNNSNQSPIQLYINGNVSPKPLSQELAFPVSFGELRLKSTILAFGTLTHGTAKSLSVPVYNSSAKPASLSFGKLPSHITVTPATAIIAPGKELYLRFSYNSTAVNDLAFRNDKITLIVNGNAATSHNNILTASAYLSENFGTRSKAQQNEAPIGTLSAKTIKLGKIQTNKKASGIITITNTGKSPLLIRKAYSDCGCIHFSLPAKGIAPGQSYGLHFVVSAGSQPGYMIENVNILTNSPVNAELQAPIQWEISR